MDGVQHHDSGTLDDLVFQGGNRQRSLPSVCLRYTSGGTVGAGMPSVDLVVQISDLAIEIGLVIPAT